MAKTSVYLNKEREAAVTASGKTLLELLDLGLAELPSGRTALYLLHDSDGDLLYVGITSNPERRFLQHAREKPWWGDVETKTVEWLSTRKDAEAAERAAIATLEPRHNGVPGRKPQPDSRRVTLCFRLSEAEAAAIDKARGKQSRSDWLLDAALAKLRTNTITTGTSNWPDRPSDRRNPARQAACPHRLPSGAYCKTCETVHR